MQAAERGPRIGGRGLLSSTFQLNVSTFCPMRCGALLVSVTKSAQGEQRSGRVQAPDRRPRPLRSTPTPHRPIETASPRRRQRVARRRRPAPPR